MFIPCKITPKIDIGQIINIKALFISYKVTRKIKRQESADSHRIIKHDKYWNAFHKGFTIGRDNKILPF